MFGEFVDLFSTQGGTASDHFCGILTAAIACIRTGHKCFTMEKNKECFEALVNRLRRFLPTYMPSDTIPRVTDAGNFNCDKEDNCLTKENKVAIDVLLNLSNLSDNGSEKRVDLEIEELSSESRYDSSTSFKSDIETDRHLRTEARYCIQAPTINDYIKTSSPSDDNIDDGKSDDLPLSQYKDPSKSESLFTPQNTAEEQG